MWFYETDTGVFWIRFDPCDMRGFVLGIGEEVLGSYYSPEAAVDDVYMQKSGFPEWDDNPDAVRPPDLSGWVRRDCADWKNAPG